MSNKLDLAAVEQYSKRYAAKVCDEFFSRNDAINGQQIMNLSTVGQVNLFVVSNLFSKWQAENARLRSAYFDFENETVQQALKVFMNTLSQYISVKREYFEPLLKEATAHTLVLLLDPKQYFEGMLSDLPDYRFTKEQAKQWSKYTRLNKFVSMGLENKFENKEVVSNSEANIWLNDLCEGATFEEPDKYLSLFSAKVSLEKDSFFEPDKPSAPKSFFDWEPEEMVAEKIEPIVSPKVVEVPVAKPIIFEEKIPEKQGIVAAIKSNEIPLHEKFANDEATLNDSLKKEEPDSLAEVLASKPLESIPAAISLNQKIMFINQLFHGDAVAYTQAIMELEECKHFDEAKSLIIKQYSPKYLWKMSPDEAEEFVEIVRRRFT